MAALCEWCGTLLDDDGTCPICTAPYTDDFVEEQKPRKKEAT